MMRMMRSIACAHLVLATMCAAPAAMAAGAVVSAPDKSVLFWSTQQPSERIAINRAMANCGAKFGGGCMLEKSFENGCIAVARSNGHRRWAMLGGRALARHRRPPCSSCFSTGSQSCSIQTTKCE